MGNADVPAAPTRPKEEIARLGDEIYERDIRREVEADHHGEVVAIDVDSGDYAVAKNVVTAWERLVSRRPDGGFWFVQSAIRPSITWEAALCRDSRVPRGI